MDIQRRQQEIEKFRKNGHFFTVEFVKKDQTKRKMLCKFTKLGVTGKGMNYDPIKKNLIPVMDVSKYKDFLSKIFPSDRNKSVKELAAKQSFRCVNLETLISINDKKVN